MTVYRLSDDDPDFPSPFGIPPEERSPDGLIAVGGDLSPDRLICAYAHGAFPWTVCTSPELHWYCPAERFVIFPNELHISHSLRSLLRKDLYDITLNEDFSAVIRGCSAGRIDREGAWLGEAMIDAYTELFRLGRATSVEVWRKSDGSLAGGLYGVLSGRCFAGESMFSLAPSASKIALVGLTRVLRDIPGAFIDCQFETPHLRSMGGRHIPYHQYLRLMHAL